ncbi:hypothetical protein D9613_007147 [Agrocybe pediades]|uniref:BTB domain-containing protein n=1 Tax=Agrocybe pediades TaxID=84607 RepID=A0A8H4QH00_9AGAR|nr:hypothetical protein D9613_007147 [Agrocybe pediades]
MMIKVIPAPPPFDRPEADIILRSSDKEPVDFRVFKILLSLSSPFFADLFSLPQPSTPYACSDECVDGMRTPVMQVAETAETLRVLLGFCFPISAHELPRLTSFEEIQRIAEAASKYEMIGIIKHLKIELLAPRFVESQPLRAFAIAHRYGWDAEARKAARYTLRHPIEAPFMSELELISGATLHRLQDYHRTCREVASSRALLQLAIVDYNDEWEWLRCTFCAVAGDKRSQHSRGPRQWWTEWIEEVAEALRQRPWGEVVRKYDLMQNVEQRIVNCQTCKAQGPGQLEVFAQMLAAQVERDISKVALELKFDDWTQCSLPLDPD